MPKKKPRLPKSVTVDGCTYAVCLVDELWCGGSEPEELCGCVAWDIKTIFIAKRVQGKKLTAAEQFDVLTHEMLHIVVRDDGATTEDFVSRTATKIAQALTRNHLTRKGT